MGIITRYEVLSEEKASWHEVHPLIVRTREFMEFHFSVEESLMRLLPYPDCGRPSGQTSGVNYSILQTSNAACCKGIWAAGWSR